MGRPRRKKVLFALVALALALALSLLVLEAGLRLLWTSYYVKEPGMRARPSVTLGWENRPSVEFTYGEPEFVMAVRHDERGFRGPGVPATKPAGGARVLAIGDSFTYGIGVQEEETYAARLEALEPRLQVINAGVQGYGTTQALQLYRERGALDADVVLLGYFWNDLANNVKGPRLGFELGPDGAFTYTRPTHEVRDPGPDFKKSPLRGSYAYRFLSDRLKMLKYRLKAAVGAATEDPDLLRPDELDDAWAWQEAALRELKALVTERGARLVVAIIPDQVQVHPDVSVVGLSEHYVDVQPRLLALGERLGIPMVDLTPGLRDLAAREGVTLYHRYDRHLNAAGQDAAARLMLDAVRQAAGLAPE
ncbi:MAG: SGNH/GDSL hydrolase family protein [Planctomycetes bacterium]|nr:SGNH/GDSL hydrolase family protein [Planctomycetota bacterium]